jgi:alanyl-tRNA synthetase
MKSKEIRQSYLDFFKENGHTIVPSSSLLPDAPNLLFTNAGMNQFVPIFLGQTPSPYQPPRAADTQKCIRAGGKHNDLEDVGQDTSHHTFFEMLGNWSFGDYFKEEAINWAWELLVKHWQMPTNRLYATYFGGDERTPADEEARQYWLRYLPETQVLPGSRQDNFWMMGDTGPCGPSSEIHMDLTAQANGGPSLVNSGSPACLELWNLVFIQFNANSDGTFEPLPAKHVDTGLGFERVCGIMQCTDNFRDFTRRISNYESDLFSPYFEALSELSGQRYLGSLPGQAGIPPVQLATDIAFRVIADHIRCLSFAVADGISPSNEGRGYVLRRILRRAVRYGRSLSFRDPFFYKLVDIVAASMGDVFPEVRREQERIKGRIKAEEEQFNRALDRGIEIFNETTGKLNGKDFPAIEAFKLYDTFGFPLDLTQLMAREQGFKVDTAGFEQLMEQQRRRAREDHEKKKTSVSLAEQTLPQEATEFIGYDQLTAEATVSAIVRDDDEDQFGLVVNRTPFYAEMGGQVGDSGWLGCPDGSRLTVIDTQLQAAGVYLHIIQSAGMQPPTVGDKVTLEVDAERRAAIARHHTATHLFHWAIQELTAGDIRQRGSLVAPDRLRFDFNYPEKLSETLIASIEELINQRIAEDHPVLAFEMPYSEIKDNPAIRQLFGEKYSDKVRILQLGGEQSNFNGFSMELCGGTHVSKLSEVSLFKITRESAISAGIRRIEAVCGELARAFLKQQQTREEQETEKEREKECQKEDLKKRRRELQEQAVVLADQLIEKAESGAIVECLGEIELDGLRAVNEILSNRIKSGALVLAGIQQDRVSLICYITPDLVAQGKNAGKIVGELAKICGGGGGGRPDLAQAGGKLVEKIPEALARAKELII